MTTVKIANFQFNFLSYKDILELFKKDTLKKRNFCQIISLNPENFIHLYSFPRFKKLVNTTQTLICDGVGMVWAARFLGQQAPERITGVELMDKLVREAVKHRLGCLLIGGHANLAELTAKCYRKRFPTLKIRGLSAIESIKKVKPGEIQALERIVSLEKPSLVFVAFGSPDQELWIEANKPLFKGCLVMGVGGSFAMLSGVLPRAPKLVRQAGLEWLFRLAQQPWRIRRQFALLKFIFIITKLRFFGQK